jgi:GT2 family glycosyltransferase
VPTARPAADAVPAEVTVVVVTWQGRHLLGACLTSLATQTVAHDLLVVDNASTDGTTDLLAKEFPHARVLILDHNGGFAGGIAAALPLVGTPFVALLNNDAEAEPQWLERSLAALRSRPDAAAMTARMMLQTQQDVINNAGVVLVRGGYGADRGLGEPSASYPRPQEVFGFSGGAAVLRTDPVRTAGGMPARFFMYYEDTDLAWRLRLAGWQIWYEPRAVVAHRHAASAGLRSPTFAFYSERNRLLMLMRCAPAGFALSQIVRFGLTTMSLFVRRVAATDPVFQVRLRMRVIAAVIRLMPWALRERRDIGRRAARRRSEVSDHWIAR